MAKEQPTLVAEARTGTGKGAARQARRNGKVPGIVYGDGKDPVAIQLDFNPLLTRLRAGRFMSTLWTLKVEGQPDARVVCRGVQRDVVKDLPTHIDFMRVRANSRVNLFINVVFENEEAAPGLKRGGTLVVVRNEIELMVNASDIPEQITIDLTGREIGDSIHINDITLPKGTKSTIDRNFVIANIAAPSGLRSEENAEGGDAAEGEDATQGDAPAEGEAAEA